MMRAGTSSAFAVKARRQPQDDAEGWVGDDEASELLKPNLLRAPWVV